MEIHIKIINCFRKKTLFIDQTLGDIFFIYAFNILRQMSL